MAKITVTNQLSALRAVFNKMDEVYYSKTPLTVAKLASAITVDMELPVLSDGVTFNTGEPETTEIDYRGQLGDTNGKGRFGYIPSGGELERGHKRPVHG